VDVPSSVETLRRTRALSSGLEALVRLASLNTAFLASTGSSAASASKVDLLSSSADSPRTSLKSWLSFSTSFSLSRSSPFFFPTPSL
jgi:hypothetical protein